ncbi:MAG: hypothetical protein OFPI_43700 [Osedax symbiont Rs2]|nr:MAG: hypothetical protein OFPI_43700 [Osedax symbiont Rs2]
MQLMIDFLVHSGWDLIALTWFLCCFKGYLYYARYKSYDTPCLANVLHKYRYEWMMHMLEREVRIADETTIANLERSVSFFASTTILIIAGLITLLGSSDAVIKVLANIPVITTETQGWTFKIICLIVVFLYAFFKFTWSLRQYGFLSVMVGSAPTPAENCSDEGKRFHAQRIALMCSKAAGNFNLGLRTYYFSVSMLSWFISPVLFMFSAAFVALILYRREFRSETLQNLMMNLGEIGKINLDKNKAKKSDI